MDIELAGGGSVFLRALVCRLCDCEDPTDKWECARLSSELSILRWFKANAATVPVPRVLAFDEATCLLVTTRMPGLDAMHSYHRLSPAAKVCSSLFFLFHPRKSSLTLTRNTRSQAGVV
jgi:hypothetical protein